MKVKVTLFAVSAFTALCGVTLLGCHANLKLYPVQGPLAQLTPPPAYTIKLTGGLKPDHLYAVVADEKATCDIHNTSGKEADSNPSRMTAAWDAVYGDKYYEGHILGSASPYHWCEATGEKGTTFAVAIFEDDEHREHDDYASQRVKGVMQDNKGNIFKFTM